METKNQGSTNDGASSKDAGLAAKAGAKIRELRDEADQAAGEARAGVTDVATVGGNRLHETAKKVGHRVEEIVTKVVHSAQEAAQKIAHGAEELTNEAKHRRQELANKAANKRMRR